MHPGLDLGTGFIMAGRQHSSIPVDASFTGMGHFKPVSFSYFR